MLIFSKQDSDSPLLPRQTHGQSPVVPKTRSGLVELHSFSVPTVRGFTSGPRSGETPQRHNDKHLQGIFTGAFFVVCLFFEGTLLLKKLLICFGFFFSY